MIFLICPIICFLLFIFNTVIIDKVYYRPDSNGITRFSLKNLWIFIKTPLLIKTHQCKFLWTCVPNISWYTRLKILSMNWIFMVIVGFIPYVISNLIIYCK